MHDGGKCGYKASSGQSLSSCDGRRGDGGEVGTEEGYVPGQPRGPGQLNRANHAGCCRVTEGLDIMFISDLHEGRVVCISPLKPL